MVLCTIVEIGTHSNTDNGTFEAKKPQNNIFGLRTLPTWVSFYWVYWLILILRQFSHTINIASYNYWTHSFFVTWPISTLMFFLHCVNCRTDDWLFYNTTHQSVSYYSFNNSINNAFTWCINQFLLQKFSSFRFI